MGETGFENSREREERAFPMSQQEVATMHSVERSLKLFEKAQHLMPGGCQLVSRRPSRWAFGVSPIYAERAKGCRIWDIDGNEYVDWTSAVGPIILGYADEVVDAAVREQMSKGSIYSILHESEIELAEELIRLVPSAEMVRYAKGGGGSLYRGGSRRPRCYGQG